MQKKLKRVVIIAIAILVVTLPVFIFTSFSLTEEEQAKADAIYGDIYNQQTITLTDTSTTINGYNYANGTSFENLDVEIRKTITKDQDELGKYNINFEVRGKESISNQVSPTYVVFVVDKSYSMKNNSRWTGVANALSTLSASLSNISGVQMAAIGFSGGKATSQKAYDDLLTMRDNFSATALTTNEIGNYETNNSLYGATNMQGGLLWAKEKMATVEGTKIIILIGDGVPTIYYDENGYSKGTGNSNTQDKLNGIPEVMDATKIAVDEVKSENIEIFSIGYYLDKYENKYTTTYNGKAYNEYMFATEMIQYAATNENYYFQVDSNKTEILEDAKEAIITRIATVQSGYNVTLTDNIGENFKLIDSNTYGGTKVLNPGDDFKITNDWKSIGNFDISIDKMSSVGWYPTNNDFTLTYYDHLGNQKSITVTEDPEVYWGHTLTLCKKVIGVGNGLDFNFNIKGTDYDSWVKITGNALSNNNNEYCENVYLDPGEYQISEVVPEEYTLTDIEGLTDGSILIEGGNVYTVTFTNEYEKKGYYHTSSNVQNIVTNKEDVDEEYPN